MTNLELFSRVGGVGSADEASEDAAVDADRITARKERAELSYWRDRFEQEGCLSNDHYEEFFTRHFGLDRTFYREKRILDIGCGPRGSLEWAGAAAERVGLDPLADAYTSFGTQRHAMQYVRAAAEAIPYPDAYFDVVSSLNSLDHVENLDAAIAEIVRVLAPGGRFLLICEVNHPPTPTEPHFVYLWSVVARFEPELAVVAERRYERREWGIYGSIGAGIPYDESNPAPRSAIVSAMFVKPREKQGLVSRLFRRAPAVTAHCPAAARVNGLTAWSNYGRDRRQADRRAREPDVPVRRREGHR